MTDFLDFYKSLMELVESYKEKKVMLRIESDLNEHIIRIFGENASSVSRAINGLDDVIELSSTTAEHHPFWSLLANSSQISKTALEKWKDDLTKEELDEINWHIDELKNTCKKLQEKLYDEAK